MHLLHLENLGSLPTSEFVAFPEYFGIFFIFDVLVGMAICEFSLTFSFHALLHFSFEDIDFFPTAHRIIFLG